MPLSAATTLRDASLENGGFYVPQFEVRIAGAGLPRDVLRDVVEITYRDKIEEIDSCEITINNWDAGTRSLKYIGAEGDLSGGGPDAERARLFEPCNKTVELWLGYGGALEQMMIGTFTTMEPSFPASGASQLQVRMLNQLHQLRRKKFDGNWTDKTDSEIVEDIAGQQDGSQPRFPVPLVVNDEAKAQEKKLAYVAQRSEFDVDFLWRRARLNGYVVLLQDVEGERSVYFGPSDDAQPRPDYTLEWGRSLIEFKPTLTTANQFRSVTVRGWDRAAQRAIEEKVDLTDPEIARLNANLHEMLMQCDPREDQVVEKPVFTREEARRLARQLLLDQHRKMVKATGSTIGLPKLRAGAKITIPNIGSRLSGTYFVTATTHTFNNSGYLTRFECRREDEGDGSGGGA